MIRRCWLRLTGRAYLLDELTRLSRRLDRQYDQNEQLRTLVDQLTEPADGSECTKVRLRDDAEAERFARKAERDLGYPTGTFTIYRCRVCPRQPITSEKFRHICNADPELRAKRNPNSIPRTGRRELGGFDPTDLARIKDRLK